MNKRIKDKCGQNIAPIFPGVILVLLSSFNLVVNAEEPDPNLEQAEKAYNSKKSNDKYHVVCKREAPVGSRIKKKVCRTVATTQNSERNIKRTMQKMRTSVGKQP